MKIIDSWGVFGDGMEEQDEDEEVSQEEPDLDWDNVWLTAP